MMDATRSRNDFWSRRRAAVEAEATAEAAAREAAIDAEAQLALEAEQAEKTDAELLAELGLQTPEEMDQGDDFSAFMRASVPERLRRRALRVLWRSNPVLANLDGLLDHGDDFTDAATVVPDMKTAYQVGKGMLHHVQVLAAQVERLAAGPHPEIDTAPVDAPAAVAANVEDADVAEAAAEADGAVVSDAADWLEELPVAPRRHMRFSFSDATGREL